MAKVLVVTSGKGGVGKTTSTAALGAALAQSGQSVVVVDFDVGLRNLDLVMGAERRVVFDLINVVQGVAKLPQALIKDKRLENLWLLPASRAAPRWRCDSPTRPSSSPIRKSPRCAIPTASSACSIPRRCGPRRASASRSIFSSPATTPRAPRAARC